ANLWLVCPLSDTIRNCRGVHCLFSWNTYVKAGRAPRHHVPGSSVASGQLLIYSPGGRDAQQRAISFGKPHRASAQAHSGPIRYRQFPSHLIGLWINTIEAYSRVKSPHPLRIGSKKNVEGGYPWHLDRRADLSLVSGLMVMTLLGGFVFFKGVLTGAPHRTL